jgi:hypothetical protein
MVIIAHLQLTFDFRWKFKIAFGHCETFRRTGTAGSKVDL